MEGLEALMRSRPVIFDARRPPKPKREIDVFQRLDIVIKKESYEIHCVVNYHISLGTHWV